MCSFVLGREGVVTVEMWRRGKRRAVVKNIGIVP